jgi:hypothetical protein
MTGIEVQSTSDSNQDRFGGNTLISAKLWLLEEDKPYRFWSLSRKMPPRSLTALFWMPLLSATAFYPAKQYTVRCVSMCQLVRNAGN